MPTRATKTQRRHAHLIGLEPRMMFDAAAVETAAIVADRAAPHDGGAPALGDPLAGWGDNALPGRPEPGDMRNAIVERRPDPDAADLRNAIVERLPVGVTRDIDAPSRHEIVFIDTAVADYRQLADAWAGRAEVVLIDGTRDGVTQLRDALAGRGDIDAIHIVSHGAQGVLFLGTTRIDDAAITGALASSFAAIGRSLSASGDLLLYGCDFGAGTEGARAIADLAAVTGADVAASTDTTGYAGRGGDWTLEARQGAIETRDLDGGGWVHTLDPNNPVPISVTADSLTVTNGAGTVVATGSTGYDGQNRSPDVGVGAVAVWANAATFSGRSVDLKATIVSLTAGDAVRFNRPGIGSNPDDPTFLLRDLTTGASDAIVQIRWELVDHATGAALPADVRFTIADIDGIGGDPNTRESVTAGTTGLAYYTRERVTDINFTSSLAAITASGTQNENTDPQQPISPASAATFDWSSVSQFTLTYQLTTNSVSTQAQFYHDGDADFVYADPVYVSIPRLDLDTDDSTAPGNDAHFTFTENGSAVPLVDSDVRVSNPMPSQSIQSASVVLTNAKPGDALIVGTLPSGITAIFTNGGANAIAIMLSGAASETDYATALRAISFRNTSDAPDTTQRVVNITFSNDTLTSATAVSRIDVIAVNDAVVASGTLPNRTAQDAATVSYATAGGFADPDGDALTYTATGLPAGLTINSTTGVISGTVDRSASQVGGGVHNITVTARDPSNTSATQTFRITVTNPPPVARNDTVTTNEDTPATIAVLANDTDPDGDPLTVTGTPTALHGTVVRNPDNTLTYMPNANYNGGDTINYTISDGEGGTSSATVTVTVTPVNDAPTATGTLSDQSTQDAATVSYPTAGGFSDIDGDTLSYTATGLPAGLTINAATGVISGTIDRAASQPGGGIYTVVVTARDPSDARATQSFQITVTNPPPTATNDSATTAEDTPVTIAVLANDTDPDGDPLTITSASAQHGTVVRNPDGTLTYTPASNYNGSDTISYQISDGNGGTSSATVAVTITPVNDAPAPTGALPDRAAQDAGTVSYQTAGGFTDAEGDTLTYSATGLPAGLVIDATTGIISGTLGRSASQVGGGVYSVTVTARDPSNATGTQTFRITVTDPPPVATNDSATTAEDTPVTIAVLGNDSDPDGDPLSVTSATALHGTVVRNPDGTITYTPNADYAGSDTISYRISDGEGGTADATVAVTITPVNDAPAPNGALPPRSAQDAATVSYPTAGGFTDVDGDTLSYSATGLPAGLAIDATTGIISGTLGRSASQIGGGVYSITVTARDPSNTSGTQTFQLTVTNPPPVATNDSATTAEDTPVTFAVLGNDSDPDGDPISVIGTPTALHGTVVRNPDNTLTYTPNANYNGGDTITYRISDGEGGTADGTVAVTITPVNDAPVAAGTLPARATQDAATVSYPTAGGFTDIDGDALSYTATGLPVGLAIDAATGVISGTVDRSASQVGGGVYAVVVTARDPSNASASQSFQITVTNPGPAAVDDSATTGGGTPVTIAVLGNDSDTDGDPLAVTTTTAPAHGAVVRNSDNTLTYTPTTGYLGQDSFTYTISDGQGGTATATVTIDIVNRAPVATNDSATTPEDTPVTIAVLANDTDPDGDPLSVTSASALHGTVVRNLDGTLTYTPAANYNGADTISYQVTDGHGGTATATVAVTVAPVNDAPTVTGLADQANDGGSTVNVPTAPAFGDVDGDTLTFTAIGLPPGLSIDPATGAIGGTFAPAASRGGPTGDGRYPVTVTATDPSGARTTASFGWTVNPLAPVARDDAATTTEDTPVTIAVLANDTDGDGDPLTVVAASSPDGAVTINPDGTLSFIPRPDRSGPATIAYTVSDPTGRQASAVARVMVTPANDAPDAAAIPAAANSDGQTVSLNLGGYFTDRDGDPLTFAATGLPAGLTIDAATGVIAGTVDRSASVAGPYRVTVTAADPSGARASSSFDWAIVNPAPAATDDGATTGEDTAVVIPVLANDRDPDGDPLAVTAATASHGTVTIRSDGTLFYIPSPDFNGNDVIRYTISDGQGGQASASVLVTVMPVNDAPVAVADTETTTGATPVSIAVLANDRDADGDPMTVTSASAPNGLVTINPDGTLTYVARAGYVGGDTISYTIGDGHGGTASASVAVTVLQPNRAPVGVDDTARTDEDTGLVIPVLANDRDADGDPLTVTGATATTGTVSIAPDGSLRYRPGADFAGTDTVTYKISDGRGGTASATVTITVDPVNDAPIVPGRDPVDAVGGRSLVLAPLASVTDPEGNALSLTSVSAANGTVEVRADGTIVFTPALAFVGTTTITFTVSDGRGGLTTGTIVVRVADGRAADVEQLLRIGRVQFHDPAPSLAVVTVANGAIRTQLSLIETAEAIRPLHPTAIGDHPIGDAVAAIRSLRGTGIDADAPIAGEIRRLDGLRDHRDAGDRLFDRRWNDFRVAGRTGFSAAADRHANVMFESSLHGGAIYLEVRDTAAHGPAIRSVDVRPARGGHADWIHVDRRGLAIIERGADMDELHLVVRVTRADGHVTATPIVIQGATGEIELDRHGDRPATHAARPLNATLSTPAATRRADADRLSGLFE